ncbi:C1QL [Mytilus edulis]|uniref:C1QL n=1 Tax=Mytilus edulis TaxID=6550 RepID=A0A8S3QSU0_MYTED|nr:C1QL [Mytilus edulis]
MFVALPILVQGLLILIPHCKATNDKIAAMLSRLEVVEKKVEQVEKENEALKKENKRISEKLETCECANSQTNIDVKGPGETVQVKYNNKNKLNGTTSLRPLSSQFQNVKTLNSEAHKRHYRKRLSLGTPSTTIATTTRMAFLAGLSKPITSLGSHQAINYDLVLTNEGQAYDSLRGHMVAPVKGLYLVSACVFVDPNNYLALDLFKNGQLIANFFPDGRGGHYDSESKTLPLVLEKEDIVWMRTHPGSEGHELSAHGGSLYNSFPGVLLYEM